MTGTARVAPPASWPPVLLGGAHASRLAAAFATDPAAASTIIRVLADPDFDPHGGELARLMRDAQTPLQQRILEEIKAFMFGGVTSTPTGSVCADVLRLRRFLREGAADPVLPSLALYAARAAPGPPPPVPVARVLLAAAAAAWGYSESLRSAPRVLGGVVSRPGMVRPLALLALRSVLEGSVTPAAAVRLAAPIAASRRLTIKPRLVLAAIALHHASQRGDTGGVAYLLSHVMQALFANALANAARAESYVIDPRQAIRTLTASELTGSADQLMVTLATSGWRPWSRALVTEAKELGIDLELIEQSIGAVLGSRSPHIIWPVYLNSHLARATLFAMAGLNVSANANLASVDGRLWLPAFTAVRAAVERANPRREIVPDLLRPTELVSRLHATLLQVGDPSASLGIPIWSLEENRAQASLEFASRGALSEFRKLRQLLARADVRASAEPFWLLTTRQRPAFRRTVEWLANRIRSVPNWRQFADDIVGGALAAPTP